MHVPPVGFMVQEYKFSPLLFANELIQKCKRYIFNRPTGILMILFLPNVNTEKISIVLKPFASGM